jgi:hypothetical protein
MSELDAPIFEPRRSGRWSTLLLIRRHLMVFFADRTNVILLLLQPILIGVLISVVAMDKPAIPKKLFLGYIAALWLGCSNAAQVIVRERPVFLREKQAGLKLNNYLFSKFVCMGIFACIQAGLLYAILAGTGTGLIGDRGWQIIAIAGSAVALSGVGLAISAHSRTTTQAILWVPLIIIPQILFSGYVFSLKQWREGRVAAAISRVSPSYAAQRLVDISLFWNQTIDDDVITDYRLGDNLTNLGLVYVPLRTWILGQPAPVFTEEQRARYGLKSADFDWPTRYPELEYGNVFNQRELGLYPIWLLLGWYVGSYGIALVQLARSK